ncbi:TauD/TfdA family dioxygenase [Sorangium sp. So ce1099]|uniref:TauD/TfdA family dioxygenase n=1 Tax=Sorangium sp. So ce1099 TaxID=3133331 RepID=UPI003F5DBF25
MVELTSRGLLPGESSWPTGVKHLPLVIEPARPLTADSMTSLLRDQRAWVQSQLTTHGAILLRGTPYREASHFVDVMNALGLDYRAYPHLTDNYRRPVVDGVVNASSTEAPLPVPPHTEQAFSSVRPGVLGFMCLQRAPLGGQTPLHDCVAAFRELTPATKEMLQGAFFCKVTDQMSEEAVRSNFNTLDRAEIDQICKKFGLEWSWNGGKLSFVTKGPCVVTHPITGETAFSCFWTVPSIHYFFRHYHGVPGADRKMAMLCRAVPLPAFDFILRNLVPFFRRNYRYFLFKEGKRLDFSLEMHTELNAVIWKNTTVFEWQPGDILMIDNIKVGHSRMPFVPPRHVVASVCNYYDARERRVEAPGSRRSSDTGKQSPDRSVYTA